jgi:hypothetical protein
MLSKQVFRPGKSLKTGIITLTAGCDSVMATVGYGASFLATHEKPVIRIVRVKPGALTG